MRLVSDLTRCDSISGYTLSRNLSPAFALILSLANLDVTTPPRLQIEI